VREAVDIGTSGSCRRGSRGGRAAGTQGPPDSGRPAHRGRHHGEQGAASPGAFGALPGVLEVLRVSHPYKLVSREFHPEDTIVSVGGVLVGGTRIVVIAGPCAVESLEQTLTIAKEVKARGSRNKTATGSGGLPLGLSSRRRRQS